MKDYLITRENYKTLTQEQAPFVKKASGVKKGFALCPYCENPIVIVGLYRKVKNRPEDYIYGRHYRQSVTGVGEHYEPTYLQCKYAVNAYNVCPQEERSKEITDHARNIYKVLHDYYDKIIYVLQESLGYKIPYEMAEAMIRDYIYSEGILYPPSTIDNLPWMLMYISAYSIKPWSKHIRKDSELYKALSKIETVRFENIVTTENSPVWEKSEAEKYQILRTTKFTQISVLFLKYYRKKQGEDIKEFMSMTISYRYHDSDEWICADQIELEIDDSYLQNVLQSKKSMAWRNKKLLQIADENMPSLPQ